MSNIVPEPDTNAPGLKTNVPAGVPRPGRGRILAIVAGVVAAIVSWGACEATSGRFQPKRSADAMNSMAVQFENEELNRTEVKNAALAYGLQGAILGLVLGLAGAAARGSAGAGAGFTAAAVGLLLGGTIGSGAAIGAFMALFRFVGANHEDLLPVLLAHEAAWAPIGAVGGLAFGLGLGGRGRVARALAGGVLGAAVAVLMYEAGGSLLFPLDRTGDPVAATSMARLFAHGAVGLLTALGAVLFCETARPAPARV